MSAAGIEWYKNGGAYGQDFRLSWISVKDEGYNGRIQVQSQEDEQYSS